MEAAYAQAPVDACCARPVTLTNGPRTGRVARFGASMTISRADVAWWCWERLQRESVASTPQLAA